MPDESDPPRKHYGFKPRDFERVNAPRPDAPAEIRSGNPRPPEPVSDTDPAGRIDVRELARQGAATGPLLSGNAPANRPNDVHAVLRENLKHDRAAGHYDLGTLDDSKRRRRIRNYVLALIVLDGPLAAFTGWVGHSSQGAAMPFVCSIAAIALITSVLTWKTFFLRTNY